MHYYLSLIAFIFLLMALWLGWQNWLYFRRLRLQKKIAHEPFPPEWLPWLERIPHYRALPPDLREELQRKLRYFIATKEFIGIKIDVTDEMRVVIAFYACLLVLKIPNECYEALHTILIYPYDMIAEQISAEGGIYRKEKMILEGQSAGETVVIAWHEAKRQAYHLRNHNVVLHELAHVLDFEEGGFDGIPPLERSRLDEWSRILHRHYCSLHERAVKNRDWGRYRLIGEYAATNEAEFFAVTTELFFQKPLALKKHFPDLYEEYREFYGLDTASLFKNLE